MNEQVAGMKTGDLETSEVVIESEREYTNESVWQEFISCTVSIKVIQASDNNIISNRSFIIKNKGNMKGVGINNNSCQKNQQNSRK